jgi:hypothetical protein
MDGGGPESIAVAFTVNGDFTDALVIFKKDILKLFDGFPLACFRHIYVSLYGV